MFFPVVDCEPSTFIAMLAEATRSDAGATYTVAGPLPSPLEAERFARNHLIEDYLVQALGDDPQTLSPSALENFRNLLALLPGFLPATDPYVSKQGSIVLDWDFEPQNQLSIMLKGNGQIAFAAYLSGEKVHGSTVFSTTALPASLATVAKQWAERVGVYSRA